MGITRDNACEPEKKSSLISAQKNIISDDVKNIISDDGDHNGVMKKRVINGGLERGEDRDG